MKWSECAPVYTSMLAPVLRELLQLEGCQRWLRRRLFRPVSLCDGLEGVYPIRYEPRAYTPVCLRTPAESLMLPARFTLLEAGRIGRDRSVSEPDTSVQQWLMRHREQALDETADGILHRWTAQVLLHKLFPSNPEIKGLGPEGTGIGPG